MFPSDGFSYPGELIKGGLELTEFDRKFDATRCGEVTASDAGDREDLLMDLNTCMKDLSQRAIQILGLQRFSDLAICHACLSGGSRIGLNHTGFDKSAKRFVGS
jgi:hypothetical protein